jgi:vancomycin resistance protein YoaR
MSQEEIDLVEQIFAADSSSGASSWRGESGPDQPGTAETAAVQPVISDEATDAAAWDALAGGRRRRRPYLRPPHLGLPRFHIPLSLPHRRTRASGLPRRRSRVRAALGLAVAFVLGAVAVLAISAAVVFAICSSYSDKIAPGVRIGTLDLGGMSRDEAIEAIDTAYAYLGQGEVVISTPTGSVTLSYKDVGRGPDAAFMADQAMQIGHTGNPIEDTVNIARTALGGQDIAVAVKLDPLAVATGVRQFVYTHQVLPANASATVQDGIVSYSPAFEGSRIDEVAISRTIVAGLVDKDAPGEFQVGAAFVKLMPQIGDGEAQDAIAAFQRMATDVHLQWTEPPPATPTPAASGTTAANSPTTASSSTPAPSKTFAIEAATVRKWISIGGRPDGTYGPIVNTAAVQAAIADLTSTLRVAPVEPHVTFDSAGKPNGVAGGREGVQVDVVTTAQQVVDYLNALGAGSGSDSTIAIAPSAVDPQISVASLSGMTVIGSWTTIFYPGITNGNGINIRLPASILNGQVVMPGQQFSFLKYVGPIDAKHGFTLGGVIKQGKSDHTGAMGGGICSASTTMFNAAARAGLQIDERHAHYYYINRYPVGLDATVFSNGVQVWDLKWTNDTPNPIVIRGYSTGRSTSKVTMQLWSLPTGRKTTFTPDFKANVVAAKDTTVYVTTLKPGQQNRAEYPTPGFDTSKTRTVTDATGKVIHTDTWFSHYIKVDGRLEIGKAAATPTPAPTAAPSESSAVVLPPADQAAEYTDGVVLSDGVVPTSAGAMSSGPASAFDFPDGALPPAPASLPAGRSRKSAAT